MSRISPEAAELIDGALSAAVDSGGIPGVVAVATDRNGVFYESAFGIADLTSRRPMRTNSIFRIASMTKAVISVAGMQMVEQGYFQLDDPVERHLPMFAEMPVLEAVDPATGAYRLRPQTRSVTVRHLFTHTSGLGYPFTSPLVRDYRPPEGDPFDGDILMFDPGEQWLYGRGLTWLGRLIERKTGKPLETYLQDHVFGPAGMMDTSYFTVGERLERLVTVNRRHLDGSFAPNESQLPTSGFTPIGCGGLTSTGGDYARFIRMLLNEGEIDGRRLLAAETVALMAEDHIDGIGVRAHKSADPLRTNDFTFIADGLDGWGLGFLISADGVPGKRSTGSLSWGGINNSYFWIDRANGIAATILMQFLPFADSRGLALYDAFERNLYRAVGIQ